MTNCVNLNAKVNGDVSVSWKEQGNLAGQDKKGVGWWCQQERGTPPPADGHRSNTRIKGCQAILILSALCYTTNSVHRAINGPNSHCDGNCKGLTVSKDSRQQRDRKLKIETANIIHVTVCPSVVRPFLKSSLCWNNICPDHSKYMEFMYVLQMGKVLWSEVVLESLTARSQRG